MAPTHSIGRWDSLPAGDKQPNCLRKAIAMAIEIQYGKYTSLIIPSTLKSRSRKTRNMVRAAFGPPKPG